MDWFHLTRRLTVLDAVLHSREAAEQFPGDLHQRLSKAFTSLKWRLWHGRPDGALQRLDSLLLMLERAAVAKKPVAARLRRLGKELRGYLQDNRDSIPNYAQRYRTGQRIVSVQFPRSSQ